MFTTFTAIDRLDGYMRQRVWLTSNRSASINHEDRLSRDSTVPPFFVAYVTLVPSRIRIACGSIRTVRYSRFVCCLIEHFVTLFLHQCGVRGLFVATYILEVSSYAIGLAFVALIIVLCDPLSSRQLTTAINLTGEFVTAFRAVLEVAFYVFTTHAGVLATTQLHAPAYFSPSSRKTHRATAPAVRVGSIRRWKPASPSPS